MSSDEDGSAAADEALPVKYPVHGELDLHTFRPQDAGPVVEDYLEQCREQGILSVRIIHGKGIGQLRQTVHKRLSRLDYVASFSLAGEGMGGWGATLVQLHRLPEK